MTRREFLRRLRRTRGLWMLDEAGCIRDTHKRCPIEVVLGIGAYSYAVNVAAAHHLRNPLEIMVAADNGAFGGTADLRLRKQLLAATVDRRQRRGGRHHG